MASSMELQQRSNTLPVYDDIGSYMTKVNSIPLLTESEEVALATRYQEQADLEAAHQLVLSHLRYVARIARQYAGYGLSVSDLLQEGTIGLMKAVKRFDPKVGVRLVTFAVHWIKAEMHEFILRNWRIVRVATTKAQRKLFFNLRSMKKGISWFTPAEAAEIAQDLGVTPKDVLEMESRLAAQDASFDLPGDISEETAVWSPSQYLEAPDADPALQMEAQQALRDKEEMFKAIAALDDRSQEILRARFLGAEKASLKDLAAQFGISLERVRQIEARALTTLRQTLQNTTL